MFIVSVKTTRKKLLLIGGIVIFVFVLLGIIISGFGTEAETFTVNGAEYSLKAHDNEDRRAFLTQFGWESSEEPVEVVDIRIPAEFNDVYTKYNDLQKSQGFNLEKYTDTRVKRCTYEIKNYPGETEGVRANLLIFNGLVIGGDISSVALDGFMHGFDEGAPPSEDTSSRVVDVQGDDTVSSDDAKGAGNTPVTESAASEVAASRATDESDAAEPTGVGEGVQETVGEPEDTEDVLVEERNLDELG